MSSDPNPPPLNLDNIERTGATRFGRPVSKVVLIYEDEAKAVLPLPEPTVAVGAARLTPTQEAIVRVLRESPIPLTRKAVATRLGKPVQKDRGVVGRLGEAFRELVRLEVIFEEDDAYTDDRSKFTGKA